MQNLCFKCKHEHECIKYTHRKIIKPYMKETEVVYEAIADLNDYKGVDAVLFVYGCERYKEG